MLSEEPPLEAAAGATIAALAAAAHSAAAVHSAAAAPAAATFAASMPKMPSFAFTFPKGATPAALAKSTPDQLAVYKKNFEAVFLALQLKEAEVAQLKVAPNP